MKLPRFILFALLILANLVWSGSFVATTLATRSFSPTLLTTIRLLIGGLILFPFVIRTILQDKYSLSKRAVLKSALLGILGFTFPVTLETIGIHISTPALGAVSIALEPLFTVFIAALLFRHRLSRNRKWAMLLAAIGAWVVGGCPRPGVAGYIVGDLVLLCAVLCYATYNAISSRLTEAVPPAAATSIMLLAGFFGCLPIWFSVGHPIPHEISMVSFLAMVFLSVLATAGAYLIWLLVLQGGDVASAAITLYLQPIFGVVFSILIVHTKPSGYFYVGAALILIALYIGRQSARLRGSEALVVTSVGEDSEEAGANPVHHIHEEC